MFKLILEVQFDIKLLVVWYLKIYHSLFPEPAEAFKAWIELKLILIWKLILKLYEIGPWFDMCLHPVDTFINSNAASGTCSKVFAIVILMRFTWDSLFSQNNHLKCTKKIEMKVRIEHPRLSLEFRDHVPCRNHWAYLYLLQYSLCMVYEFSSLACYDKLCTVFIPISAQGP